MKRNLMDLLKIIATKKMRPATERDNPYFFGTNVFAIDLGDDLLMFGKDPENEDAMAIYYQTADGSMVYRLDITVQLNDLED